jgi:putative addiction module killer protein
MDARKTRSVPAGISAETYPVAKGGEPEFFDRMTGWGLDGRKNRSLTALSSIDYSGAVIEREIKKLELQNGLVPFDEWFDSLRDKKMQAAVDTRVARVRAGNFGDVKPVGAGVFEMRVPLGSGLRVYYGLHGRQVVVLLGGGEKRSQSRDIRRAQELWQQFTKHASSKLQR